MVSWLYLDFPGGWPGDKPLGALLYFVQSAVEITDRLLQAGDGGHQSGQARGGKFVGGCLEITKYGVETCRRALKAGHATTTFPCNQGVARLGQFADVPDGLVGLCQICGP